MDPNFKTENECNAVDAINIADNLKIDVADLDIKIDKTLGLALIYSNDNTYVPSSSKNYYKSIIFDIAIQSKSTEKSSFHFVPIATQYNKMITNINDIHNFIRENYQIMKCMFYQPIYEGTHIIMFYHKESWRFSTRRALDARQSYWINLSSSYYSLVQRCLDIQFPNYDFNKEYVYHFNLIDYTNKHIIDYTSIFGSYYSILKPLMITEKASLKVLMNETAAFNEIIVPTSKEAQPIKKRQEINESLDKTLEFISNLVNEINDMPFLSTKGFVIEFYDKNDNLTLMNVQNHIYQEISQHIENLPIPVNINFIINWERLKGHSMNNFTNIPDKQKEIKKNIELLSNLLINLYFITRRKKVPHIYDRLTDVYKKILYTIHGKYLEEHTKDKQFSISRDIIKEILKNSNYSTVQMLMNGYDHIMLITGRFEGRITLEEQMSLIRIDEF